MSHRIRGQEAIINVTVADEFAAAFGLIGRLGGSFAKVRNMTITPRIEQSEEGFIGDDTDELDQQLNGYDFSFTVDETDSIALDFLSLIAFKENNKLPRPVITVSVSYIYRDLFVLPRTEVLLDCIMKPTERTIGGRKEYIQNSFEGKARDRKVMLG